MLYNRGVNKIALQLTEVIATEKNYNISRLLDFYGEMLPDRQRLAVSLYYNDDLSLSEVAEELGISRQGVRASLKRSEETLCGWEAKLGLAARFEETLKSCKELRKLAEIARRDGQNSNNKELVQVADRVTAFTEQLEKEIT